MSDLTSLPAYGGPGWEARARWSRDELGSLWASCGLDSEWLPLKSVLLHKPGRELEAAAEKGFTLDRSVRMVNAQYPDQERISTGTIEIRFYPAGYSDRVLIHLEDEGAERISFLLEPLLPKLKIFEEWIEL